MAKAKRVKKVFKNKYEVAHIWATQSQDEGRDPSGSGIGNYGSVGHEGPRIFFEKETIYSYGYHFVIAKFVDKNTVLITNEHSRSPTTNQHIRAVEKAITHLKTFEVYNPNDLEYSANKAAADIAERCFDTFKINQFVRNWQLENGRGFNSEFIGRNITNDIKDDANKLNELIKRFKLKEPKVVIPNEVYELIEVHVNFRLARQLELFNSPKRVAKRADEKQQRDARDAEWERERLEEAKKAKEKLADWLKGGQYDYSLQCIEPQRIRVKGNNVETTGSVTVPLTEALALLKAVQNKTITKGFKIGEFTFERVNGDGTVDIGCHTISISDAETALMNTPNLTLVQ